MPGDWQSVLQNSLLNPGGLIGRAEQKGQEAQRAAGQRRLDESFDLWQLYNKMGVPAQVQQQTHFAQVPSNRAVVFQPADVGGPDEMTTAGPKAVMPGVVQPGHGDMPAGTDWRQALAVAFGVT